MGYRSKVVVAFYVRSFSNIKIGNYPILKLWFDENYPHTVAKTEWGAVIDEDSDNGTIIVTYEDAKWYSGYTHPQQVEAALDQFKRTFEEEEATAPTVLYACEAVRIGEELTDIDHNGSDFHDYRLDVIRTVEFN